MDKSFQAVVNAFKPAFKAPTHKVEIMRLYRSCLRTINSWSEDRDVFNEQALKIRAEFDANKNLPQDSPKTVRLVREAKDRLDAQMHPDPYIVPFMPGGSLFMRNPAIPLEALYPDGIPKEYSRRRLNIDMSNIPDSQEHADKAFVDSVNKQYWIEK